MPNHPKQRELVIIIATVVDSANTKNIIKVATVTAVVTGSVGGNSIPFTNENNNIYKANGDNTTSYTVTCSANNYKTKTKNITPATGYTFNMNLIHV